MIKNFQQNLFCIRSWCNIMKRHKFFLLSTDGATWGWPKGTNFPKPSLLMNYLIKSSTTVEYQAQQCVWTCKLYFILWWREVKWTGAWAKLGVAGSLILLNVHVQYYTENVRIKSPNLLYSIWYFVLQSTLVFLLPQITPSIVFTTSTNRPPVTVWVYDCQQF